MGPSTVLTRDANGRCEMCTKTETSFLDIKMAHVTKICLRLRVQNSKVFDVILVSRILEFNGMEVDLKFGIFGKCQYRCFRTTGNKSFSTSKSATIKVVTQKDRDLVKKPTKLLSTSLEHLYKRSTSTRSLSRMEPIGVPLL